MPAAVFDYRAIKRRLNELNGVAPEQPTSQDDIVRAWARGRSADELLGELLLTRHMRVGDGGIEVISAIGCSDEELIAELRGSAQEMLDRYDAALPPRK